MTFHSMAIAAVVAFALASAPAQNRSRKSKSPLPEITNPDVQFTGEVERGKAFQYDMGRDLYFRLEIAPDGDFAGWDISVIPKTQPPDGPIEFSAIATPPYHSFNERYLETIYGYSAKEILEMSPRRFNFVLSENDERRAEEAVNVVLYPNSVSEDEKQRIAESAANIQVGTGEFTTLKFRVTPVKDPLYPGSIEWIKFEVKVKFPPGQTMAQVLAPAPPEAPSK